MHPFFDGLRPTIHVAHRGGAALGPENTIEACRLALEQYGTDMVELDLQMTLDGVLVVAHDERVERCTDGHGAVAEMSLAEVQGLDAGFTMDAFRGRGVRIPTLVEMLRAFPDLRMNLELKPTDPALADLLIEVLRAEGAVRRVCVGSEHDVVAERLSERLPEACCFYPRDAMTGLIMAVRVGQSPPRDPRWHVLDMPLYYSGMRLVEPPLLEAARQAGVWVNVWTVNEVDEMKRLRDDGVGGIMTDRPDLLREVLGERRN